MKQFHTKGRENSGNCACFPPAHEPPPLPPFGHPLPLRGGEGRGEGAVGWFKGARHAQSSGRSLLGERAGVRASVSSNPIFGVGGSRYFRFQISDFGFQTQPPYVGCYAFWPVHG